MTSNAAAAPVPRFGTVTLPAPAPPRLPFPDPRQTSAALPPPQALSTSSSIPPAPPAGQPLPPPLAGQPPSMLAAASTARSATSDGTETITVTNVVSAPAINKLGSLFNSLNKTVTGALNTFITQQQQQQQQQPPGQWQPVGQQFNNQQQFQQQQHPQHPQQTAPTAIPVQRFPLPQAVPVTRATGVPQPQPPQQPPGVPRLPSDGSSAFIRVGPTFDSQTRPDAPPQQHRPPAEHQYAAPPPVRNHIEQPPPIAPHLSQAQQFTNAGEIYREMPRNHVDPRVHLSPTGGSK